MKNDSGTQLTANTGSNFSGESFLLLLGLPTESNVLIVGRDIEFWSQAFQNPYVTERISTLTGAPEKYDLIMYHSASANSRRMFNADLKHARQILAPNGSILLFAEKTCSYKRLKGFVKGRLGSFAGKLWYGQSDYQGAIHRAGFNSTRCFLPLPCLERPEEMIVPGSKTMELPDSPGPLNPVGRFAGPFALADGFVFLGGNSSMDSSCLLQTINDAVSRQLQLPVASCALERMDIRLRGAFILFLRESNTGKGFIARLVSDRKIDGIVGKNHALLENLQTAGLPLAIKGKLPRPICRMELANSVIYVETMVAGIPAWKICHGQWRQQILLDAVDFLRQVHFASRQNSLLSGEKLGILLADDRARLANCTAVSVDFRERMMALMDALQQRLLGTGMDLVISHGDYGYGNILVDPQNGTMQGVIDWDTGRTNDFPGVDMINLLVQKERAEKCCTVLPAFTAVVGKVSDNIKRDYHSVLNQLEIPEVLHGCIVYLGFIRYVTRAAQYPKVFCKEQSDYLAILELLSETLPL